MAHPVALRLSDSIASSGVVTYSVNTLVAVNIIPATHSPTSGAWATYGADRALRPGRVEIEPAIRTGRRDSAVDPGDALAASRTLAAHAVDVRHGDDRHQNP